jgi:hypothetical protein
MRDRCRVRDLHVRAHVGDVRVFAVLADSEFEPGIALRYPGVHDRWRDDRFGEGSPGGKLISKAGIRLRSRPASCCNQKRQLTQQFIPAFEGTK